MSFLTNKCNVENKLLYLCKYSTFFSINMRHLTQQLSRNLYSTFKAPSLPNRLMICQGHEVWIVQKKERKNLLENFLHQSQKWLTAKNKFLVFRATAASRDFVNFYKFTYWARFFTTYLIKNYLPKRLILQLSLIFICVHFRPTPYLLTCKVLEVYCRSFQIIKGVTFKPLLLKLFTFFPATYWSNFTQIFFFCLLLRKLYIRFIV